MQTAAPDIIMNDRDLLFLKMCLEGYMGFAAPVYKSDREMGDAIADLNSTLPEYFDVTWDYFCSAFVASLNVMRINLRAPESFEGANITNIVGLLLSKNKLAAERLKNIDTSADSVFTPEIRSISKTFLGLIDTIKWGTTYIPDDLPRDILIAFKIYVQQCANELIDAIDKKPENALDAIPIERVARLLLTDNPTSQIDVVLALEIDELRSAMAEHLNNRPAGVRAPTDRPRMK